MHAFFDHVAIDYVHMPGLPRQTTLLLEHAPPDAPAKRLAFLTADKYAAGLFTCRREACGALRYVSLVLPREAIAHVRLSVTDPMDNTSFPVATFALDELELWKHRQGKVEVGGRAAVVAYRALPMVNGPRFAFVFLPRERVRAGVNDAKTRGDDGGGGKSGFVLEGMHAQWMAQLVRAGLPSA